MSTSITSIPDPEGDGYEILVVEADGTAVGKGRIRIEAHPQNGLLLSHREGGQPLEVRIEPERIVLAAGGQDLVEVSSGGGDEPTVQVNAQLRPDAFSVPHLTAPPIGDGGDTGSMVFDRVAGRLWIWDGGAWRSAVFS